MEAKPNNHSFIVRMWREQDSGLWRATVQDVTDAQGSSLRHQARHYSPNLAAMMTYLYRLVEDIESDHATGSNE